MMRGGDLDDLLSTARRYAALSASFEPLGAVKAALGGAAYEPKTVAQLLAKLRADCMDAIEAGRWVMRSSPREKTLLATERASALDDIEAALPTDEASVLLRDAFLERSRIDDLLDDLTASPKDGRDLLEKITAALSQLGRATRFYNRIPELRSALNRANSIRDADEQLSSGFFGHEQLLIDLAEWIDHPPREKMARTFYIGGLPGVGKSFLIAKAVQDARIRSNPIVLSLDFDRRGLNLLDTDALSLELARQMADEVPNHASELSRLRLMMSGPRSQQHRRSGGEELPFALAEALRDAVADSGRPVLLVLDTLEVLRGYGDSHPDRLFRYLDQLVRSGIRPLSIVAAGRGDALETLEDQFRIAYNHLLEGLEPEASKRLLEELEVPAGSIAGIVARSWGNPLLLRLAAKAYSDEGASVGEWDAADGPERAQAYLYRFILSRIADPDVRLVANFGLVLQAVDAGVVSKVLAPALAIALDASRAAEVLSDLRTNHWLVSPDDRPGWVKHRADVRAALLEFVYADDPATAADINRRAADFFVETDQQIALYHRLQLVRADAILPEITRELVGSFTDEMISELPEPAADAVRLARGQRSRSGMISKTALKAAPPQRVAPDAVAVRDLELLLEQGDMVEAEAIYQRSFVDIQELDAPGGGAALCHRWLSGRWSMAHRQFGQLKKKSFSLTGEIAPLVYDLVALEMRAEFEFDALVGELKSSGSALERAAAVYRGAPKRRLTDGPLAFALVRADQTMRHGRSGQDGVAAAAIGFQDSELAQQADREVHSLRDRYRMGSTPQATSVEASQVLNPYARPAGSLFSLTRSPALQYYLNGLMTHFGQIAGNPLGVHESPDLTERLMSDPSSGFDYLAAAGATADWLIAFTFFHPIPHMPSLARRSEAWRRTAAGAWSYDGGPPEGWWTSRSELDGGTAKWLDASLSTPSATEDAATQVMFWATAGRWQGDTLYRGNSIGKRAGQRLLRAMDRARRAASNSDGIDPVVAAVRSIQEMGIGRSLAVPLTILSIKDPTRDRPSSRSARQALEAELDQTLPEPFERLRRNG